MRTTSQQLAIKINELIKNKPDWDSPPPKPDVQAWVNDVYAVAKEANLSDELVELRHEIDVLTSCLDDPSPSIDVKKSSANKIENVLYRALSITETKVQATNNRSRMPRPRVMV